MIIPRKPWHDSSLHGHRDMSTICPLTILTAAGQKKKKKNVHAQATAWPLPCFLPLCQQCTVPSLTHILACYYSESLFITLWHIAAFHLGSEERHWERERMKDDQAEEPEWKWGWDVVCEKELDKKKKKKEKFWEKEQERKWKKRAGKRFRAWMKAKVDNKRGRKRGSASEEAKNKYWDRE